MRLGWVRTFDFGNFSHDVIVEKVINIYQNCVIKRHSQTAVESVWPVSKLSTESVGSRRELVANCVHTADANATKQFRRVGVGGVYWALGYVTVINTLLYYSANEQNQVTKFRPISRRSSLRLENRLTLNLNYL